MTQENRIIKINTQLDNRQIQLRSFQGYEEISRLFRFDVDFICIGDGFKHNELINKLVGQNVTLSIEIPGKTKRYFNGHVSRVTIDYEESSGIVYRAELVPWLWFLTKTTDCRIFQNKKTPDIIKQIFKDLDFKDHDIKLNNTYRQWEYCVQYRETDFNFVSRLMEEEGIYYYFKHQNGKHTLFLRDDPKGYYDLPEKSVPYQLTRQESRVIEDHINSWERRLQFETGAWAQTDYNFKHPSNSLMTTKTTKVGPALAKSYENYDYPGEYIEKEVGQRETQYRIEEEETTFNQTNGSGTCKSFSPAGKFKLTEHPNDEEKGNTYVITSIHHSAVDTSRGREAGAEYTNTFTCIQDSVTFRPARITPKPVISGVQTAVVVGPEKKEVYTDQYGRVKVRFFWDREEKREDQEIKDEDRSCFIRCAQNIAGKKWGFMAIPRIGQEVVVDFLEGDPDRPLIVGSVYNDEQKPHYDPEQFPVRTYIKSNTSEGGDGFNELFFDDTKDDERVFIHAEHNMDVRVKATSKERIIADRHLIVGWEKDGKQGGDQNELVHGSKNMTVKKSKTEVVEGSLFVSVGGGDEDPGVFELYTEKKKKEYIGKDGYHLTVEGARLASVGGDDALTVGGEQQIKVSGSHTLEADGIQLKGNNITLDAGQELTLIAGGNYIQLGPTGISIEGTMVRINCGGMATGAIITPVPGPETTAMAFALEPEQAHNEKTGFKSAPDK